MSSSGKLSVPELSLDIETKLKALNDEYTSLDLRGKVLRLVSILQRTRNLNVQVLRTEGITARGARERLEVYMVRHTGVVLDGIELEVVSGISEYGRRIRELRVQDGYKILTRASNDPGMGLLIKPSQYILLHTEPDREAAHRWHIANRIRKQPGAGKDRILNYLQANVGSIVTTEEIAYVAKVKDSPRRTRELRTEDGYSVYTRFTGRPDLRSGEYVLESVERVAEPHDRHISEEVQRSVYARDENTCQLCGWFREKWTKLDPRFLELHHIEHHSAGGENIESNLVVLCNRCHDDVHARRKHVDPR